MAWWHAVAERDHEIQNPTSVAKIRELGERLGLGPESRVVDVAAGMCGPAIVLASTLGCRVTAVERAPEFTTAAQRRIDAAGVGALIEVHEADARTFPFGNGQFDAALCLGATFVWDGLDGTLAALVPAVRPGGHVAVGECYWQSWPLPAEVDDEGFVALGETVARLSAAGLTPVALLSSSEDDWDRYESLHWQAVDEWLRVNPAHEQADEFRRLDHEHRERYLRLQRGLLGWALLAGRKA